jgi:hypothetical protein
MSRLLPRRFFALVPIPELQLRHRNGARPSCNTRPGLPTRPWVGARSAPQQSPILRPGRSSLGPSCLHTTSCTTRPAIPRPSHASCSRRDISELIPHAAKPINPVPFPLFSIGGTGTRPQGSQPRRCQPAAVRRSRPGRSSDSSSSPSQSSFRQAVTQPRARSEIIEAPSNWLSTGGVVLPPGRFADCAGLQRGSAVLTGGRSGNVGSKRRRTSIIAPMQGLISGSRP